jgi:ribosomal protein L29
VATTTNEVLRQLSAEDLTTKVRELKEELFNLRFQAATGQLKATVVLAKFAKRSHVSTQLFANAN